MRILKAFAFVAAAGAMAAGFLQAQSGTGTFLFMGTAGSSSCYQVSTTLFKECVRTSPYRGKFTVDPGYTLPRWMLPPEATTVDIFCLDFLRGAITGTTYDVSFTNLGYPDATTAATNLTSFTHNGGSLTDYLAAAALANKIKSYAVTSANAKDITGAIWQLLNGANTYSRSDSYGGIYSSAGIASWRTWGLGNTTSIDPNAWVVASYRNRDGTVGASQDWLVHVTPEPTTLLLLGTGLLATLIAAGTLRRSAV